MVEARWSIVVLVGLSAVGGAISWMGTQPDPTLFGDASLALSPGEAEADRGRLPKELVQGEYAEGKLASFGPETLCKKINGRADFFLERGLAKLYFLPLNHTSDASEVLRNLSKLSRP